MVKPVQTGTADPSADRRGDGRPAQRLHRRRGAGDPRGSAWRPTPPPGSAAAHCPASASSPHRASICSAVHDLLWSRAPAACWSDSTLTAARCVDLAEALADGRSRRCSSWSSRRLALGTLNHTELTVDAAPSPRTRRAGLILGSVPDDLSARRGSQSSTTCPRVTGLPVLVRFPAQLGALEPDEFQAAAGDWFGDPIALDDALSR